jgi:hypothetical protein
MFCCAGQRSHKFRALRYNLLREFFIYFQLQMGFYPVEVSVRQYNTTNAQVTYTIHISHSHNYTYHTKYHHHNQTNKTKKIKSGYKADEYSLEEIELCLIQALEAY